MNLDLDVELEQTPFIPNNPAYGSRGYGPVAAQSALHFIRYPTGMYRMGLGDFYIDQYREWSDDLVKTATQDGIFISKIKPSSAHVHFDGAYCIFVKEPVSVEFNRPVSVLKDLSGEKWQYHVKAIQMQPGVKYHIGW